MAAQVLDTVRTQMADGHLKAAIVRVTVDGREVLTEALGESMTGVPGTTDMHFRNGAVAISYVATLLLQLVDDGTPAALQDKLEYLVARGAPTPMRSPSGQLGWDRHSAPPDYVQRPRRFCRPC